MSAVWAILLDTSSSMNEGFTSRGQPPDPLAETGPWQTKLEVAKQLLHRQVTALRTQEVIIIGFSQTATKLFDGLPSAYDPRPIDSIRGSGRTSIAAALDLLMADDALADYDSISVLVLTDGLANEGDAPSTAQQFIERHPTARIDTILIDPTDEGDETAKAISINGFVRPAYSTVELRTAIGGQQATGLISAISDASVARLGLEYDLAVATHSPPPVALPLSSAQTITTRALGEQILPAIGAIQELQSVASEARGEPYQGRIISISVGSAPKITMSGVRQAIEVFLELLIPWKRQHAQHMQELDAEKRAIEIEREKAELQRFSMETERYAVDSEHHFREMAREEELARREHAYRQMRMKLEMSKLDLRDSILHQLAGHNRDLPPHESQVLLQRISAIVSQMENNPIEFERPITPEDASAQRKMRRRRPPRL